MESKGDQDGNDDATTVRQVDDKGDGVNSHCDTNSKNVPVFHITSKRKREKKNDLKKNINNLPTKNLQEKMKKMITNNIKYDKAKDKKEKLT